MNPAPPRMSCSTLPVSGRTWPSTAARAAAPSTLPRRVRPGAAAHPTSNPASTAHPLQERHYPMSPKRDQPVSANGRSPMLPRNVTTNRPELERRLLAVLDTIEEPVSVATAIRDRDGRILDFRLEFVNLAAASWAGIEREALIGLITGELLPEFRSSGYFDT